MTTRYATLSVLAARWGLSRQRAFQLSQMDGFPKPQKNVAGVNVYDVAKADAFRGYAEQNGDSNDHRI